MVRVRTRKGRTSAAGGAGVPTPAEAPGASASAAHDDHGTGDGGGYVGPDPDNDPFAQAEAGEGEPVSPEGAVIGFTDHTDLGDDGDDGDDLDDDAPAPAAPARNVGGRPKGSGGKKKAVKARRASRERSTAADDGDGPLSSFRMDRQAVKLLLLAVEGMAVPQIGPHARFEPDERKLIEEPLERMLGKLTPRTVKMVGAFADPIMLGTGLMIWASRVFSVQRPAPAPRPVPTPRYGPDGPTLLRPSPVQPTMQQDVQPPQAADSPPAAQPDGIVPDDLAEAWSTS